jgi:hypothetical protein
MTDSAEAYGQEMLITRGYMRKYERIEHNPEERRIFAGRK